MNTTTRFGFEGGEPGGPPAADGPRAAKTVFGRDLHVPAMGLSSSPHPSAANEPARHAHPPRAAVAMRRSNTPTAFRVPSGSEGRVRSATPRPVATSGEYASTSRSAVRLSARVAKARFFGRRNTAGNFVPHSQTDLIALPRPFWMRPLFTVCAAAIASFLLVAAILWALGISSKASRKVARNTSLSITESPIKSSPAASERTTSPPMAPTDPASQVMVPPVKAATVPTLVRRNKVRRQPPQKQHSKSPAFIDPDAPLPPTFF